MEHDEIEVKYHITDISALRLSLIDLGARSSGRLFEENIRLEDARDSLISSKSLLRLRRDAKNTLTYKQALTENDNQYKIYREIETEVTDFDATRRILESLGFFPRQVYEKYRETFAFKNASLCLDTMPYGDFLEIESERIRIRELSDLLGFSWETRILATYLEMFEHLKKEVPLPFGDLTFANFRDVRYDFSSCWKFFEQNAAD